MSKRRTPEQEEAARAVGDVPFRESKDMYDTASERKKSIAMAAASIPGVTPPGYVIPADPALSETYWPEGHPPMSEERPQTSDTYTPPPHGWTCFHCGETFTTEGAARDHFGTGQNAAPGCIEKVACGGERGLLMALRKVQQELARCYEEDSDALRFLAKKTGEHADQLRVAEETGYARALADVIKMGVDLEAYERRSTPKRGCGGSYEIGSGGHVPGTPGEGCAACDRDFGPVGINLVDDRATYTGDHMEAPSKWTCPDCDESATDCRCPPALLYTQRIRFPRRAD